VKDDVLMSELSTRDRIFNTATDLFKEKGYNEVTINDICEACEITKSTFYYHLKSKQEIILHYYDHIIQNLTPILVEMLGISSPWEQTLLLFDSLIDKIMELGYDINSQLMITNLQENHGIFDLRKDLADIAIRIIQKGQEAQQIRNPSNPELLYEAAAYMFTGYEFMWCTLKGNFDWKGKFFSSLENIFDVDPTIRTLSK
jgi:AcrR family transcriptional regulator